MRVTIGSRPGASGRNDLARAASILENGAARRAAADLLRDLERTQRRAAAPGNVAKAELRSRDRVGGERRAILQAAPFAAPEC